MFICFTSVSYWHTMEEFESPESFLCDL